jgi:PAS domain S-box-containing protein
VKLFWKIGLLSLGSVLFCTVLLTAIVSYLAADKSLAHMRSQQRLLAETAASQVETGYYDQVWPFEMLSGIAKETDFISWQIVNGHGVVVLSSVSTETGRQLERFSTTRPFLVTHSDHELWIVPMRMRDDASPWQFRLGYSTGAIRTHRRSIIATNALIGLALAILFVGATLYVSHRMLRPLSSLTSAVAEVERGRLDAPLPAGGNDEIGKLVAGFSAMIQSVKDRDEKIQVHLESLEAARASLESRVVIRTQELHASETRTRAVIEYAADAIVTLDDGGVVEVFNPAASRIFGYAREEICGQRFDRLIAPQYVVHFDRLEIECIESGTSVSIGTEGEIHGRRPDGTTFPMHIALSEVNIDGNRLLTAIVRDITERKRADAEKQEMHERLVDASRQAGMAEVASNVLHNVGNVLNSINISASLVCERLKSSRMTAVSKTTALLREHADDLVSFLTTDKRGRLLPTYLDKLGEGLLEERRELLQEMGSLTSDIEHVKQIVKTQQSYARVSLDVRALVDPRDVMEDALRISSSAVEGSAVQVIRDYALSKPIRLDRHKTVHILVNLINNAKQAVENLGGRGEIRVCIGADERDLRIDVVDNGVGIQPEHQLRIFNHGFTTKPDGHGFGLHGAAISATEMGGSLTVHSDGSGCGARFTLALPLAA